MTSTSPIESDATAITAYQYGLLAPLDWGDDCEAEIERMRRLWNQLVEIEHRHRDAVRAIGAGQEDVATATAAAEAFDRDVQAALTERNAIRQQTRSRRGTPELDARIAALRAERAAAWRNAKTARKAARSKARPELDRIEADRRAAVKAARQSSGCYWGNYNAVIGTYDVARQHAIRTGGELRFRSAHRREARLVNQIQGGGRFADAAEQPLNGQVTIRPHDLGRMASGRPRPEYRLTMTVFSRTRDDAPGRERRTVTWPLILHRPMADDAVIKEVVVRRHYVGPRERWSVSFVCRETALVTTPPATACGIDIGWRRLNEGIRVATIVDAAGATQHIVLPERIIAGCLHADDLRSRVDNRVNAHVSRIRELPWDSAPAALRDLARAIRSAPKPTMGMLERLSRAWSDLGTAWQHEELAVCRDAVAHNRRDWRERSGLMARLGRARLDHYRIAVSGLCRQYGLIGMEDLGLAELARRDDNPLPQMARRYRTIAAPGKLLAELGREARRRGVRLHRHGGASTWVCAECGTEQAPSDPAMLLATCPHCSAVWDQDRNAARNLLAAALASAAAAAESPKAFDKEGRVERWESSWQRAKRLAAEKRTAHDGDAGGSGAKGLS